MKIGWQNADRGTVGCHPEWLFPVFARWALALGWGSGFGDSVSLHLLKNVSYFPLFV